MKRKGEQDEVRRAGLDTGKNDAADIHLPSFPCAHTHAHMHTCMYLIHPSSSQLSKKSSIV